MLIPVPELGSSECLNEWVSFFQFSKQAVQVLQGWKAAPNIIVIRKANMALNFVGSQ